mmetsp:Transcript_64784/g.180302  ORF Transcript_64784/g.180302 Transcript_64784/m.180302 type:complete len:80 (-) Transcript_64784:236-475(-)
MRFERVRHEVYAIVVTIFDAIDVTSNFDDIDLSTIFDATDLCVIFDTICLFPIVSVGTKLIRALQSMMLMTNSKLRYAI